jgi:hypothetical protein
MIDTIDAQKVNSVRGLVDKIRPCIEGKSFEEIDPRIIVELPLTVTVKLLQLAVKKREPAEPPKKRGRPPKPRPQSTKKLNGWHYKKRLNKSQRKTAYRMFEEGKTWQDVRDKFGIPFAQSASNIYRGWIEEQKGREVHE